MAKFVVRPTTAFIRLVYFLCLGIWLATAMIWYAQFRDQPTWVLLVPVLFFIWPVILHMRQFLTTLTVEDGRISFESGVFSRVVRTMEIERLQDVRLEQSMFQRLLNIGSLTLQTASESGQILVSNIDDPKRVSERILDELRMRRGGAGHSSVPAAKAEGAFE